ncbi:uncharacterized protein LOC122256035 [Penaeus japonicus]|uniref:uncharacterized protein LOC122256035 n=1 Tax=Penaeus japonicus TaxID=27405 RepID=UPI001C7123F0|nr:uncharacterized protein LOC122256035 [Penaeus japonicus]
MVAPLRLPLLLLVVLCVTSSYGSVQEYVEQACRKNIDPDTQTDCLNCVSEATNPGKIKQCIKTYLSPRLAKCGNKKTDEEIEACMNIADKQDAATEHRTERLFKLGKPALKKVMTSQLVKDAGPAVFSAIGQELIITDGELISLIEELAAECFTRFVLDIKDEAWHLHHTNTTSQGRHRAGQPRAPITMGEERATRTHLVYGYGQVGIEMPFHGVGPLAVDILKGKCIIDKLAEAGKLDLLLEKVLDSPNPIPSWFFQDMLNLITSITIPN